MRLLSLDTGRPVMPSMASARVFAVSWPSSGGLPRSQVVLVWVLPACAKLYSQVTTYPVFLPLEASLMSSDFNRPGDCGHWSKSR